MMRIRQYLLLAGVMLLMAGCLGMSAPLSDDFSDPASGWGSASHETYLRGYQAGSYLIRVDAPQWLVWTVAGHVYQDVRLEVNARSEEGRDNHYGLVCRYDEGAFYYFAISADGFYAIFLRTAEGQLLPLTGRAMLPSSLIHQDGTDNHLLAVCEGTDLMFYINGELVAQVADDTLARGDVGMAAGTVKQSGTLLWFDDFEADKP